MIGTHRNLRPELRIGVRLSADDRTHVRLGDVDDAVVNSTGAGSVENLVLAVDFMNDHQLPVAVFPKLPQALWAFRDQSVDVLQVTTQVAQLLADRRATPPLGQVFLLR